MGEARPGHWYDPPPIELMLAFLLVFPSKEGFRGPHPIQHGIHIAILSCLVTRGHSPISLQAARHKLQSREDRRHAAGMVGLHSGSTEPCRDCRRNELDRWCGSRPKYMPPRTRRAASFCRWVNPRG